MRVVVLTFLTALAVPVAYLGALAVNAATDRPDRWPGLLELLHEHPFGSLSFLAAAGLLVAVATLWWQERPVELADDLAPPALEPLPGWLVPRPIEIHSVVRALTRRRLVVRGRWLTLMHRRGPTAALTTALQGAGGFGKTMLARQVCWDRRVWRRFRGRIYVITVGRDVVGPAAVAAKVNDLIRLFKDKASGFEDPLRAIQEINLARTIKL
jgi:hypothetical protein